MAYEINLSLYLICHHGDSNARNDMELIRRVSIENKVPITYYISGIELEEMGRLSESSFRHGYDFRQKVSESFIHPRWGINDKHKPEIGIMTYNHNTLVLPHLDYADSELYFNHIVSPQILKIKSKLKELFGIDATTIHPPDGVYSPRAAYTLKKEGLDAVVVSGEFLQDNHHAKGVLYWKDGLRHLMRTNDLQPQSSRFYEANNFLSAVEWYADTFGINTITVGCDIDEFTGRSGNMNLEDGVQRLLHIGKYAYESHGRINLVNCNAASYLNPNQQDIGQIWPDDEVHAMQNGTGDLSWFIPKTFEMKLNTFKHIAQRIREGWNEPGHPRKEDIDFSILNFMYANDSALCHQDFGWGWHRLFIDQIGLAGRRLF
ncbi:MAG TPA: hypothetical protein VI564_07910 [Candidatus Nanoarchaeia archaeon]|nr:hypothetical protein [Candidatus Nanoarchaeia archaeon]